MLALVIRDTVFGLPVLVVFGFALGFIINNFRVSRPIVLCFGFFTAQQSYFMITGMVSDLPLYVVIVWAMPIILLFVYFTKLGYSIKQKWQFRKIGRAVRSEETEVKKEETK